MKKFAKVVSVVLALAMVLALAGCSELKGLLNKDDADGDAVTNDGATPLDDGAGTEGDTGASDDVNTPNNDVDTADDADDPDDSSDGPIDSGLPTVSIPNYSINKDKDDETDGNNDNADAPTEVDLPDAGDLVTQLSTLMDGHTGEATFETYSLPTSGRFSNWFEGLEYTEGTKIAANTPMINVTPHVALLIQPAEGVDAAEYAEELETHANPRWNICTEADTVRSAVKDGEILFMMTSADMVDIDAIFDAFQA